MENYRILDNIKSVIEHTIGEGSAKAFEEIKTFADRPSDFKRMSLTRKNNTYSAKVQLNVSGTASKMTLTMDIASEPKIALYYDEMYVIDDEGDMKLPNTVDLLSRPFNTVLDSIDLFGDIYNERFCQAIDDSDICAGDSVVYRAALCDADGKRQVSILVVTSM